MAACLRARPPPRLQRAAPARHSVIFGVLRREEGTQPLFFEVTQTTRTFTVSVVFRELTRLCLKFNTEQFFAQKCFIREDQVITIDTVNPPKLSGKTATPPRILLSISLDTLFRPNRSHAATHGMAVRKFYRPFSI